MKQPPLRNYRGEMAFLVVSPNGERLASCATVQTAEGAAKAMSTRQAWVLQRTPERRRLQSQPWEIVSGFERGERVQNIQHISDNLNPSSNDLSQHGCSSLCPADDQDGGGAPWEDVPSPGERLSF